MSSPDAPTPDPAPAPAGPSDPPPGPTPPRLTRSTTDRHLGGVAGGLGAYFGVDPILFRIGFAVLAIAGGAGALAYVGLWLLVPDDRGGTVSASGRGTLLAVIGAGALALAAVIALGGFWSFGGLLLCAALGGIVVLVVQARRGGLPPGTLARALVVTAAVVGALALGTAAGIVAALGGGTAVAIAVMALGGLLALSAFGRGRRWLLLPALALAAPLAFVAAADLEIEGGIGERKHRPGVASDLRDTYRLGMGEMRIDLRDVDFPPGRTTLDLDMGVGALDVVVPTGVCVSADVAVGLGVIDMFGSETGGVEVDLRHSPANTARAPELLVTGELDVGALRIGDEFDPDWRHLGHDRGDDGTDQPACREAA